MKSVLLIIGAALVIVVLLARLSWLRGEQSMKPAAALTELYIEVLAILLAVGVIAWATLAIEHS
jgi:hypothetical protein